MADTSLIPASSKLWVLLRSSMIGILATASDLTTLWVLMKGFGLSDVAANIPSPIPGLVIMFFGNKYFAFEDHSRHVVKQGARFLFVETWAYILNVMLFHILVRDLYPLARDQFPGWMWLLPAEQDDRAILARMIGTAITYFTFSFPFWTFIFHKTTAQEADHEARVEKLRTEVAAQISGVHLPVPPTNDHANHNGTSRELAPKTTES